MEISTEARFVMLCVRESDGLQPQEVRSAASTVGDWTKVVELATRHRVVAFVQQTAEREGLRLPMSVHDSLRRGTATTLAWSMLLNAELSRVAAAMETRHLPVMVLKGPALARTVYPTTALRPYDDLDLSVQDRHEAATAAILVNSGLEEIPDEAEDAWHSRVGHLDGAPVYHRRFVSRDSGIPIELHVDPLQLGLTPICEAARWQRALPLPLVPGCLMLCPEDQVVQLSVHAHKHGFSRLIWLKDLDLLVRRDRGLLDWGLVVSVARLEGVAASVWYSLRLADSLLATPVPAAVLDALRPALLLRVLYRLIWPAGPIVALGGQMRRRAVQLRPADSWRGMLPSLILMGRRRDRFGVVLLASASRLGSASWAKQLRWRAKRDGSVGGPRHFIN